MNKKTSMDSVVWGSFWRAILTVCLVCSGSTAWAQQAITGVRVASAETGTRVVFDLSGPVQYKMFTLPQPDRVVIDFSQSRSTHQPAQLPAGSAVSGVRSAVQPGQSLRMVLDLSRKATPSARLLPPQGPSGHRLVVDLAHPVANATAAKPAPRPAAPRSDDPFRSAPPTSAPVTVAMATPVPVVPKPAATTGRPAHARNVVIAIDAGHGGQDPGAIGPAGTYEKHVVLAIAKRMVDELHRQPGVTAKLVRTGDYFIPLKTRRDIARTKLHADLFVSVHADAALRRSARGASVFALSRTGATSSLAQMLADRENESDLVGGALVEKDDMVASVIADLAMEGAMEHSMKAGTRVLGEMGDLAPLHKRYIEKAGFAVLKSADFPSILVETGFISNPVEEANLKNPDYQQRMARAIARGIVAYFGDHPPPGTYLAWQRDTRGQVALAIPKPAPGQPVKWAPSAPAKSQVAQRARARHTIARGDTLGKIALRYRVALADLRRANGIRNDNHIRIGQVLTIPGT